MTFHVGQKVVCIIHVPEEWRRKECAYPEKNSVYIIRDISPYGGKHLVVLHELHNPLWLDRKEYGFDARGFRPVIERKTEISIFTAMLNPSKVDA